MWENDNMKNFILKIKNIIIGHLYNLFNINNKLYTSRYTYCKDCIYKEKILGINYCSLCGCPLKDKLRVEDEHCLNGKW